MSDNSDERPAIGIQNGRLRFGQAVALRSSALAGLTGVVEANRDGDRCLVRLDTLQPGVLIVLERRRLRAQPTPPAEHPLEARAAPFPEREDPDCIGV